MQEVFHGQNHSISDSKSRKCSVGVWVLALMTAFSGLWIWICTATMQENSEMEWFWPWNSSCIMFLQYNKYVKHRRWKFLWYFMLGIVFVSCSSIYCVLVQGSDMSLNSETTYKNTGAWRNLLQGKINLIICYM